jgi:hypothetical protein
MNLNQELINTIKETNKKFGYTASKYEIASEYLQRSSNRLDIVNELAPFVPGVSVNKRMQKATKELAKLL